MKMIRMLVPMILGVIVMTTMVQDASAHATGEHYAFLDVEEDALRVRLEIHETDLKSQFGLQLQTEIPSAEVVEQILAYALDRFEVRVADQKLNFRLTSADVFSPPQGSFLQLFLEAPWPGALPERLIVRQTLFFEGQPRHRGLLLIEHNAVIDRDFGEEYTALIFSPDREVQELDLVDVPGLLQFRQFLWQGAYHILIGYDHILFLVSLLLTSVLVRRDRNWLAKDSFKRSLITVAGIVTVFTIAHSVSLSLAALDIVKLPSRPVEIIIALSILVMAVNNLRPFLPGRWLVIFFFGLFHGLGFATVMGHLTFRIVDLVKVMVTFNIGVELGQLAIVLVVFPALFLLRKQPWFVPVVVRGGSVVIAAIAAYWLVDRVIA
jgi:hypothetical protein